MLLCMHPRMPYMDILLFHHHHHQLMVYEYFMISHENPGMACEHSEMSTSVPSHSNISYDVLWMPSNVIRSFSYLISAYQLNNVIWAFDASKRFWLKGKHLSSLSLSLHFFCSFFRYLIFLWGSQVMRVSFIFAIPFLTRI